MTLEEPKKVELTAAESGSERVELKKEIWEPIFKRLGDESITNVETEFEDMIRSDEFTDKDNTIYKQHMPTGDETHVLRKLAKEGADIDQEKDWDKYLDNLYKRASILIEGMTVEKAKKAPFITIENLVTNWWLSIDSFRGSLKRSKSDILGREGSAGRLRTRDVE